MTFIQVREFLRGSPKSILKEVEDWETQGGVSASGEEGGFEGEQVKGTSPPPPPSFMARSEVLRTREANDGKVQPKGLLPTQDEK